MFLAEDTKGLFSALFETSVLAEWVGNKIGKHNVNIILNHTSRTKKLLIKILWDQETSTQKCGC